MPTTKEEALRTIKTLVQRFEEQIESYKNKDYNETQTRRDFIDPFWEALGWDVANKSNSTESYREVIHEDRVKVGGVTKAPDYSFRLPGGKRMFFLEAKKPSVHIKDDAESAAQVRRYGWSAGLSVSILTNFDYFAVYDCTVKPKQAYKSSVARIKQLAYTEYITEFDFIWDTFSRERVQQGGLDKYVQNDSNKKGTSTVDKDFLETLDKWRIELAKNISTRNSLNEDELNYVVQNTIDRLIFLRIAEDRHLEQYGQLQDAVKSGVFYKNILNVFKTADQKYNSSLFDFKKDRTSENVDIDNKTIKSIISELYPPSCPYEFSVMAVEILGSAYEQFLGKQILLSKSGRAVIEEKPEVRKAGGVYYTPQYIVDYIVKNTVGKFLEDMTPVEASAVKIVDPACGSGSFLLGAYQYLLNWHKDFYNMNEKQNKGKKDSPLTPTGELTTAAKKRILTNSIYGVDLDANAAEVTKLSLLLKCLEGETKESIEAQSQLFHDRILPDLDGNIKSGNSLIGLDYYDNEMDFSEERKIKPFSWQKAFPEVFKQGGFDCVIGNPPYVFTRDVNWSDNVKSYYWKKFEISKSDDKSRKNQSGKINLYILFLLKSTEIIKENGLFSFIIPNGFLRTTTYNTTRKLLLERTTIERIVDLKENVFEGVTASTIILNLINNTLPRDTLIIDANYKKDGFIDDTKTTRIQQTAFLNNVSYTFSLFVNAEEQALFNKINISNYYLKDIVIDIIEGIVAHKKFISQTAINKKYKPMLEGKDIKRYRTNYGGNYILFDKGKIHRARPDYVWQAESKIVIQRISGGKSPLVATIDKEKYLAFASTNLLLIKEDLLPNYSYNFICALLNSKLWNFYYSKSFSNSSNLTVNISKTFLEMLPLPSNIRAEQHEKIIKHVDQLLQLNKNLQTTTLPNQKEQLSAKIGYHEDQVNILVYELYGLTDEEIEVVEGN